MKYNNKDIKLKGNLPGNSSLHYDILLSACVLKPYTSSEINRSIDLSVYNLLSLFLLGFVVKTVIDHYNFC